MFLETMKMRLRECKKGTKVRIKSSALDKYFEGEFKRHILFKNLFFETATIFSVLKSNSATDCNITIEFSKHVWKTTFNHYLGRDYISVPNRTIEKIK